MKGRLTYWLLDTLAHVVGWIVWRARILLGFEPAPNDPNDAGE
jgi:hypothetical protein